MDERQVGTDVNQVQITSLNHIIGQRQVREVLRVSIDSYFQHRATNSDSVFGPVALVGQSGCGKTITGKAIHCELANLNLIETNGEFMNKGQLLDTLVIADENTENQHILLTAISERKLYLPRNHASKAPRTIPLAPFVLILATTHEFQLQDALRNRMRIYCRFDYYSIDNLVEILRQRIRSLGWAYESEDVLQFLGSRSKKTPRLSLNYLQMAFNVASSNSRTIITKDDVIEAFRLLQVDGMGLDPVEQFYLHELAKRGSTKLNVLSSKIGLPHRTISEVIEPYLLRAELITKEVVDRLITDKVMKHILSAGKVEPE
jgi:Holliday junction DNA helicase RuvB